MNTRYNFFRAGFALVLFTIFSNGAFAQVSFSPNRLFAGTAVELDSTSAVHWIYVQWYGSGLLTVGGAQTIGTDARAYIVTRVPSKPIAPGGLDSIGVQFAPDIEGVPQAELVVSCTAQNFPSDTLPLFGEGILPHLATAAANPANQESNTGHTLLVNFDSVQMGTDSCMQIVLTNPGSETVAIEQTFFSSHDPDFTIQPLFDTLIPPGGSQTLQVCFTPQQQGFRTATVELRTNIPHTQTTPAQDTSAFFVQFNGTGISGVGKLVITGTPDYDTVPIGDTVCVIDTIWNVGTAPITITNVSAWTNILPLVFYIPDTPPVPFVLAPNSYRTVIVCAEPSELGGTGGFLSATATGGGVDTEQYAMFNYTVTVSQIGDRVSLTKPFEIGACGGDSNIATVNVANTGSLFGAMPDTYTASITGDDSSNFRIISPNPSTVVLSGNSASFLIRYAPITDNLDSASLWIRRSSDGKLSGPYSLTASQGGSATIAGDTTVSALPKQSIIFAVPLHNTGTCTWTPGAPVISQTDSVFACLGTGTAPIPANSTGYLVFTFTPPAPGNYTAKLSFPNERGISTPGANVQLNGIALSEAVQITSSQDGYSLGQSYPNPSNGKSDVELTLPEPGNVQLSIIDMKGETIDQVLNQHFGTGTFNVRLDASALPGGIYYYQAISNGVTLTREMTVIK